MSKADDQSLLSMQGARMSLASIAFTMGWSENRVRNRLAVLAERAAETQVDQVGGAEADDAAEPVAVPLEIGEGLVVRTFAMRAGGYGAQCVLCDGRQVFVVTGLEAQGLNSRVRVEQVEAAALIPPMPLPGDDGDSGPQTGYVWRLVKATANA